MSVQERHELVRQFVASWLTDFGHVLGAWFGGCVVAACIVLPFALAYVWARIALGPRWWRR